MSWMGWIFFLKVAKRGVLAGLDINVQQLNEGEPSHWVNEKVVITASDFHVVKPAPSKFCLVSDPWCTWVFLFEVSDGDSFTAEDVRNLPFHVIRFKEIIHFSTFHVYLSLAFHWQSPWHVSNKGRLGSVTQAWNCNCRRYGDRSGTEHRAPQRANDTHTCELSVTCSTRLYVRYVSLWIHEGRSV